MKFNKWIIRLFLIFSVITNNPLSAQHLDWAFKAGASSTDIGNSIKIDGFGNVYVTGTFLGTADFDPGPPVSNLTANGNMADIFLAKYDTAGNYLWAISIGSDSADKSNSVQVDGSGNVYITGYFQDTCDFDPGPGVSNLITNGVDDIFVAKYSNTGNYLWSMYIGGSNYDDGNSIHIDPSGNIYATGFFTSDTVDFDPGPGTVNFIQSSGYSGFVAKYDSSGNYLWANAFGTDTSSMEGRFITSDMMGNIFITGFFSGSLDFDPGPGLEILDASSLDIFVAKYDSMGNYVWAKEFHGGGFSEGNAIFTDPDGLYVTGYFQGSVDFDPDTAVSYLTSNGAKDIFIAKLDSSGNYVWAKSMGGNSNDVAQYIQTDILGYLYLTGSFQNTVDFDPGAGIEQLTATGTEDMFISKFDLNGNYIWAKGFANKGNSLQVDASGNLYVTGYFNTTVDFDPDTSIFNLTSSGASQDFFLAKYFQNPCDYTGLVINNQSNVSCTSSGYATASIVHGIPPFSYQWNTLPVTNSDSVSILIPGIYTVTASDALGCSFDRSVLFTGPTTQSGFDLNANLIASSFIPGFSSYIWLDGFNDGCLLVNGTLQLVLDTLVIFQSSVPSPSQISGDTLIWNFNNIAFDSSHVSPQISLMIPVSAQIYSWISFDVLITPVAGDADTTNNHKVYNFQITGSYDPNMKQVYPQDTNVSNNQFMTYTIHFQNTGNAPASNIYILDTLDNNLNLQTLRILAASHDLITEILPGNVLKFRFDNINLPDSTSNEPASHGYVIYKVNQLPNLPQGAEIRNTASIFFDFNSPVLTNTVISTIDFISNSDSYENFSVTKLNSYPNPAHNVINISFTLPIQENVLIETLNLIGQTIESHNYTLLQKGNHTMTFDLKNFLPGIYLIKLKTSDSETVTKMVKM